MLSSGIINKKEILKKGNTFFDVMKSWYRTWKNNTTNNNWYNEVWVNSRHLSNVAIWNYRRLAFKYYCELWINTVYIIFQVIKEIFLNYNYLKSLKPPQYFGTVTFLFTEKRSHIAHIISLELPDFCRTWTSDSCVYSPPRRITYVYDDKFDIVNLENVMFLFPF